MLAATFLVFRPGGRKSDYAAGCTQNIRDKPTLAKVTLMMTLSKASKGSLITKI